MDCMYLDCMRGKFTKKFQGLTLWEERGFCRFMYGLGYFYQNINGSKVGFGMIWDARFKLNSIDGYGNYKQS